MALSILPIVKAPLYLCPLQSFITYEKIQQTIIVFSQNVCVSSWLSFQLVLIRIYIMMCEVEDKTLMHRLAEMYCFFILIELIKGALCYFVFVKGGGPEELQGYNLHCR